MKFEEFSKKANEKHGKKYSYIKNGEKVVSKDVITAICPIHGEFKQKAYAHLKGQGCPKCARNQKLTTEEFIELAKKNNHNNISFEKTKYVNKRTKVIVTCHEKDENGIEHGDYETIPHNVINGCKCPKCSHRYNMKKGRSYNPKTKWSKETIKKKTEEFIQKCKDRNLDENISFEKTVYLGTSVKAKFICKKHGEFEMTPNSFLNGHSCPECSKCKRLTATEIINRLDKLYGDRFMFCNINDSLKYDSKIEVLCKEHGVFEKTIGSLLRGYSCPYCAKNKKLTNEEFINKCKKVLPKNITYEKTIYKRFSETVTLTCSEHGDFEKLASLALKGSGCPKCKVFSNLENILENALEENNLSFEKQKNFDWLKFKTKQYIDFYLQDYNIAIEVQGGQHFNKSEYFGGEKALDLTIKRDINKFKLCKENKINVVYLCPKQKIDFYKINEQYEIYKPNENIFYSIEELIEYIKKQPKIS